MFGTSVRPRLSVYRSNKYIYAQLIDDLEGHTLASASTLSDDVDGETPTDQSRAVGILLAERAQEAGTVVVALDRSGYKHQGRVQGLAQGARTGGLQW